MSAAEEWYCNRNFKGLKDGKPHDFKRGEPVQGVQSWPTFVSLKNIDWIVEGNPLEHSEPKSNVVPIKPVDETAVVSTTTKKVTKKVAKKTTNKQPKRKKAKAKKAATVDPNAEVFTCSHAGCTKAFKSSRAVLMHERYHK